MTAVVECERSWTEVGEEWLAEDSVRDESDREITREAIAEAIDALDWQAVPEGGSLTLAMMPGMGINAVISEFSIPKVSHVAVGSDLAPYGLYGIEGHYKNGRARVYVIDTGTGITPVASDFWPKD